MKCALFSLNTGTCSLVVRMTRFSVGRHGLACSVIFEMCLFLWPVPTVHLFEALTYFCITFILLYYFCCVHTRIDSYMNFTCYDVSCQCFLSQG